ncbi:hypothetical protein ACFVVX_25905 [Kitasatospora sp. NPDC058170]|uniref:hypothetical protein n=1 Tax=Kitasatospora sp. NPDC058170 TaxID=3346364 RepID=UPI0036D95E04
MVSPDPQSHWIALVDIEDFSLRPETVQATLHEELYEVVWFAFGRARLERSACQVQDRGDGMLVLLPASTSPAVLLRELLRGLQDALAEHHAKYRDDHRMRLRVGLHQGLVIQHDERWAGTAINDLARLVDAGPVRRALAAAERAHLVVVVSEELHRTVVLGRYPGIDAAAYLPADFVTKHGEPRRGWVTVPGYPAPPGLPPATGELPTGVGGRPGGGGLAGGPDGGAGTGDPAPPVPQQPPTATASQTLEAAPAAPRTPEAAPAAPAASPAPPAPATRRISVKGDYVEGDKHVTIHPAGPVRP